MDLITYSSEELGSLRPDEYFFEPASRKIYQYRNKEGKAIIVREVGTTNITKLFKNTLTVLKVDSEFDKYQVIGIDTSLTLFNANIGESFEIGFGDADNVEQIKEAFNRGDEVIAEIFDYDDIKMTIKLSIVSTAVSASQQQTEATESVSAEELKRIKEIEDRKAKKRPFNPLSQTKTPEKTQVKETKSPAKAAPKQAPKTAPKTAPKEAPKQVPKLAPKVEVKKEETKEEKKEREKREKEEQKAREKAEKESKKKKK